MNLINNIIIAVDEAGWRNDAYGMINTMALIVAVMFGLWHGNKLKVKLPVVFFSIALERALVGPLMTAILFLENGFTVTGQQNGVVVFYCVPLLGALIAKVMKRPYKELWDVMMVVPLAMFAGARISCTITGCCRGYPHSWGIYNAIVDEYLFPIQLLESLAAILILFVVICRERKNKFVPDGRNVPIILISYGIARFFLEFLHDNAKIIFGIASTQFHCMIMVLVGIITLQIIRRSEKVVG